MIQTEDLVTEFTATETDTSYTWKRRCVIYMALINAGGLIIKIINYKLIYY